jgi:hypothetical protein
LSALDLDEEAPEVADEPETAAAAEPPEVTEPEEQAADPEEQEEAPADEAQPTYKIRVDGEEVEVTLEELTKGYSRTADYTRKTQAIAETRKQVEAEAAAARQAREGYSEMLAQLEQVYTEMQPAEPDWATLRQQNPAEYAAQWADHQQRQAELQQIQRERARVQQEQTADQQKQLASLLEEERTRLLEVIPEWKDAEKAKVEKSDLMKYAMGMGYTEDDLAQVYDHRIMLVLRKAAAYDRIQSKGKEQLAARQAPAAKVLQPGVRSSQPASQVAQQKSYERARNDLARSGSVQDAAAAIRGMLD